jgi:sortase A
MLLSCLYMTQVNALEYSYGGAEDFLFASPTSEDTIYEAKNPNVDRSKNVALTAPGFGTPTSYLPGSGEYLTPNLVPGALNGGLVNQIGSASYSVSDNSITSKSTPPAVGGTAGVSVPTEKFSYTIQPNDNGSVGFTDVTSDSYYKNGSLGTLKIPAIGVNSKIVEGTSNASLAKGIGHFTSTSIWNGNVCLAAHNRGTNAIFGKIHTLSIGDEITLTTKQGTRTYSVISVEKVSETDTSGTASTSENRLTLYTCVRNQRELRYCVKAEEK